MSENKASGVVQSPVESNSAVETIQKQHVGFSPAATGGMRPRRTEDAGGESGALPPDALEKLQMMWREVRTHEEIAMLKHGIVPVNSESVKAREAIWCAFPLLVCEILQLKEKLNAEQTRKGSGLDPLPANPMAPSPRSSGRRAKE